MAIRDLKTRYTMVNRRKSGKERSGKGEDQTLIQFDIIWKTKIRKIGIFKLAEMRLLLGGAHADYLQMVNFSNKSNQVGDRAISETGSSWNGITDLPEATFKAWAVKYESASIYTALLQS